MLRWAGQSHEDEDEASPGGVEGAQPGRLSRFSRLRRRLGRTADDGEEAGPSRISRAVDLLRTVGQEFSAAGPQHRGSKGNPDDHPFIKIGKVAFKVAKNRGSLHPRREATGDLTSPASTEDTSREPGSSQTLGGRRRVSIDLSSVDLPLDLDRHRHVEEDVQQISYKESLPVEDDEDGGYRNWYDHPFGVGAAGHSTDLEEAGRLVAELGRTLQRVHPKFKWVEELVPEAELKEQIAASMPRTLRLNATLEGGERPREFLGDGLKQAVPRLVVVTGHDGDGGNIGLNGVYERHPDVYCRRPIYQKFLEKQTDTHVPEADGMRWTRRHFDRSPAPTFARSRMISPSQTKVTVLAPKSSKSTMEEVGAAREAWFLYFADAQGCWCIGPRVGSREVYARCPGLDRLVPDALVGWEVWDVGAKAWRPQKRMQGVKGGN